MTHFALYLCVLSIFASSKQASAVHPPSVTEDFSGSLKSPHYRATIDTKGLSLTEDTVIKAEHIVLEGPLATEGFSLTIDTRTLEFKPGGKIIGFTAPAQDNPVIGKVGTIGATGCDECVESILPNPISHAGGAMILQISPARHGGKGDPGGPGGMGPYGFPGKIAPGAITIFAAKIIGTPIIQGVGQTGGKGGRGGTGGQGGQGGRGTNAYAALFKRYPAGNGGDSGLVGQGGPGGLGGQGGGPIPISLFVSQRRDSLDLTQVYSNTGSPGSMGDPGPSGPLGTPGKGGANDIGNCVFFSVERPCGSDGAIDQTDPGNLGSIWSFLFNSKLFQTPHLIPAPSPSVVSLNTLEKTRNTVERKWRRFHWARIFRLLVSETVSELSARNDLNSLPSTSPFLAKATAQTFEKRRLALLEDWESSFLEPLKGLDLEHEAHGLNAKELLEVATPLVEALHLANANDTKKIQSLLQSVDQKTNPLVKRALDEAIYICKVFNRKLQYNPTPLISITSHYTIPVCLGDPDLSDPGNIDKEFIVSSPYEITVPQGFQIETIYPEGIDSQPQVAQLWPKSLKYKWRFLEQIISVPVSYAGNDQILLYNNAKIDPQKLSILLLTQEAWSEPRGYKMITKDDAVTNLAFHLNALTLLAGSSP